MPLFFDSVQRASWAGFEFPVNEIDIRGAARLYVHEYPHADGGNLEPLGRKPYTIRMRMTFDENDLFYPGVYPQRLNDIRFLAETGTSSNLVVPNVGTIRAFCPNWNQRWTAMVRSGETAEYEWIEDQSATLKQVFSTGATSSAAMQQLATNLAAFKPALDGLGTDSSLLDKVLNAVGDVVAIRDRADLSAQLAADRIASLTNALGRLDDAITSPVGYPVLESVKALWASTLDFKQNLDSTFAPPSSWIVPTTMSILDIAGNLYGDTSRSTDILLWNALDDAFAVPAGTPIRYLPKAA